MTRIDKIVGFTLLEMLLALALGALLMATISSTLIPLLKQTEQQGLNSDDYATEYQLQSFFSEIERLAAGGTLAFPTALDNGVARNSFALQFKDTGLDPSEDANGDGSHGIANMDPAADRATTLTASSAADDDRDGVENEDPINGIDDDFDGLIDEDPGSNADGENEAGVRYVDDNGNGQVDDTWITLAESEHLYWTPFLPAHIYSNVQKDNGVVHGFILSPGYKESEDDNEDGVSNNSPAITWSARQSGNSIVCTTPLTEFSTTITTFFYQEYTCMDNVNSFSAERSYSSSGEALIKLTINYNSGGATVSASKTITFR